MLFSFFSIPASREGESGSRAFTDKSRVARPPGSRGSTGRLRDGRIPYSRVPLNQSSCALQTAALTGTERDAQGRWTRESALRTSYTGMVIPRTFLIRLAPWWILLVLIGSFLPGKSKEVIGTINPSKVASKGGVALKHRSAHFLTFGLTALLFVMIAETASEQLWAGLAVAGLGFLVECSQYAFLGLDALEWWDVRDDMIAAIATLVIAQWLNLPEKLVDRRARPQLRRSV